VRPAARAVRDAVDASRAWYPSGVRLLSCSVALATLASCTLITKLDDLSVSRAAPGPTASGDGGGLPDGDATTNDGASTAASTFIAVVGGLKADDQQASDVYVARVTDDGSLSTWVQAPPLPYKRGRGGVAIGPAGIVVCGGDTPAGITSSCAMGRVDGQSAIIGWSDMPGLPFENFRHGAVVSGDRAFVIGGFRNTASLVDVYRSTRRGVSTRSAAKTKSRLRSQRSK
jgi:hypothetical protein